MVWLSEFLAKAAERHLEKWSEIADAMVELTALRTGIGPASEKARRQLENPYLMTTYPDRLRDSLERKLAIDRRALQEPLLAVITQIVELEFGELALEALKASATKTYHDRRSRENTKMYAEAANVVDRLYAKGITRGHFGVLTHDDISAFEEIIRARYAAVSARARPASADGVASTTEPPTKNTPSNGAPKFETDLWDNREPPPRWPIDDY